MTAARERLTLVWDVARAQLRREVADSTYQLWLSGLDAVAIDDKALLLRAPEDKRAWIVSRFARVLEAAAVAALGEGAQVRILDDDAAAVASAATAAGGIQFSAPSLHASIRVPTAYLAHYPVERDPFARRSWQGAIRRWQHVGADVEVDHVSGRPHLRAVVATAACLQRGAPPDRRLLIDPYEFLRAGGKSSPGGGDVVGLVRVLADWNACRTLRVQQRVPDKPWPGAPTDPVTIIDGPPARKNLLVTRDGELLEPDAWLARREPPSRVVAVSLGVTARFAALVADEASCRLLSATTLRNISRELPTYLRVQAMKARRSGQNYIKELYTHRPLLQQFGFHGRRSLHELDAVPEDQRDELRTHINRIMGQAQRESERALLDDLFKLRAIDAGFQSILAGDHATGAMSLRVVLGRDARGRLRHGLRDGALVHRGSRAEWRARLRADGLCHTDRRSFASRSRLRRRERVQQQITAIVTGGRRHRRDRAHHNLRRLGTLLTGDGAPAHDG